MDLMRLVDIFCVVQRFYLDQIGENHPPFGVLIGKFIPGGTRNQGKLGIFSCCRY